MKTKISALMDSEASEAELAESLRALREGGESLEAWREYHLISDALRDTRMLSSGFSERLAARLTLEPTVLAPASIPRRTERLRMKTHYAAAAGLAGVALVGSFVFLNFGAPTPEIAQIKPPAAAAMQANAVVPTPREVTDYLLAHQNYSPRSRLQGVAPYVRTVSESARPR